MFLLLHVWNVAFLIHLYSSRHHWFPSDFCKPSNCLYMLKKFLQELFLYGFANLLHLPSAFPIFSSPSNMLFIFRSPYSTYPVCLSFSGSLLCPSALWSSFPPMRYMFLRGIPNVFFCALSHSLEEISATISKANKYLQN